MDLILNDNSFNFLQDPEELSWQPMVKSWLGTLREQKVCEPDRNYLWELFQATIDCGFEFLKKYKEHCAINVPRLSIVRMLCNLIAAFLKYICEKNSCDDKEKKEEEEEVVMKSPFVDVTSSTNSTQEKSSAKSLLCKLYLFCYMWSFGGHFNCVSEEAEEMNSDVYIPSFHVENSVDIRSIFDLFLREMFESKFNIVLPLGSTLLFSYYVDIEKCQFFVWDHLVINATMHLKKTHYFHDGNKNMLYSKSSLIPTPDTICYSFLIALLSLNNESVLLTGNRGVGKTILIKDILCRLSEPGGCNVSLSSILGSLLLPSDAKTSVLPKFEKSLAEFSEYDEYQSKVIVSQIAFSAYTDAEKSKQAIQSKLVKRGRSVLDTRNGEKVKFTLLTSSSPQQGTI